MNRVGIEERPAVVDSRERIGDWESDTLEGAKGCGYVASHVERATRMTLLAKLPDKKAESFNRAMKRLFMLKKSRSCLIIVPGNAWAIEHRSRCSTKASLLHFKLESKNENDEE